MRHVRFAGLIVASFAMAGLSPGQSPTRARSVEQLAWMAGCWRLESGGRIVEEQWMRPRGGTMLGMARTVRGDSTVSWESTRIYAERFGDGSRLVFAATPSGQPPAEFRATLATGDAVVFENPAHDFPRRVEYRRAGADGLHALIAGPMGGETRSIEFPYRRASCD
jgi:hypothetical protein